MMLDDDVRGNEGREILASVGASGTWDWDLTTDQLHVDRGFAELYGLGDRQIGSPLSPALFFKAIHPDDHARIKIAVAAMVAGAEQFSKEFRVVTPQGVTRWMHGRGQTYF